jgi:hypothetical protein
MRPDFGSVPQVERVLTAQPGVNPAVEYLAPGGLTLEVLGSDGKAARSYPVQIVDGAPAAVLIE